MDRDFENAPTSQQSAPQPPTDDHTDLGCVEIRSLVRRKSRRLIARSGLPKCEQADVEQTLFVTLLNARRGYDPQRGDWLPFVERALQNGCKVLLRDRFTRKRHCRGMVSLQVTVQIDQQEGHTELSQLITADEADARIGIHRRGELDAFEMREDAASIIAELPYQMQELARALMHETILEIARRTGVPRSTLYYRQSLLRQAAENAGLAEYLERRADI